MARSGQQVFLVVGDQESDGYSKIPGIWFGGGGRRIAYTAQRTNGGACTVVIDDKPAGTPSSCPEVIFSPDGARYAYATADGLVVDGTLMTGAVPLASRPDIILEPNIATVAAVFSPDSKHVAYLRMLPSDRTRLMLVVDDKQFPLSPRDTGVLAAFTPDSRHLVFAARTPQGVPSGTDLVVFVDGRPAGRFAAARFPIPVEYTSLYPVVKLSEKQGAAWDIAPDGTLTFITGDGGPDGMLKRVSVALPSDTNIDTMLAQGRPVGN